MKCEITAVQASKNTLQLYGISLTINSPNWNVSYPKKWLKVRNFKEGFPSYFLSLTIIAIQSEWKIWVDNTKLVALNTSFFISAKVERSETEQ